MVEKWDFIGRALEAIEKACSECRTEQEHRKCDCARDAIKEMNVEQLLKEGELFELVKLLWKLSSLSNAIDNLVKELDKKLPQVQENYHALIDNKDNKLICDGSYKWLDTPEGRKGPYCPKCFSELKYDRDADFASECNFCGFLDKAKVGKQVQAEIMW